MKRVECRTQKELDAALEAKNLPVLVGDGHFVLTGTSYAVLRGSSHAELRESSHAELRESSHAELWGSSHAELRESSHAELRESSHAVLRGSSHAELWGSSHAVLRGSSHAELWGSSHAELWGSSHAVLRESSHAELWGSSHAELWESSHAVGSKFTAIHKQSPNAKAEGGVIIVVEAPATPLEWCDFYGAKQDGETAVLFKAVGDDYRSPHGTVYAPGTMPEAPDWDGGKEECGGGLHFCAHPLAALGYNADAKRFVACPVRLEEIAVYKNADYPNKIKAKRVCAPIWECDRYGQKIDSAKAVMA